MTRGEAPPIARSAGANRELVLGVAAVFITQFVSFLFLNARNIAQPAMIVEFDGMSLFAWLIALPANSHPPCKP